MYVFVPNEHRAAFLALLDAGVQMCGEKRRFPVSETVLDAVEQIGTSKSFITIEDARHLSDLVSHLTKQRVFSINTFGPDFRVKGVLDHITKEVEEISEKPDDLEEWVDLMLLAFDGAMRVGFSPNEIAEGIVAKQTKNEARTWPDWRKADPNKAIEHVNDDGSNLTGAEHIVYQRLVDAGDCFVSPRDIQDIEYCRNLEFAKVMELLNSLVDKGYAIKNDITGFFRSSCKE